MRIALVLAALTVAIPLTASARDEMCRPLRKFVASVQPGQTKSLEFHTHWGLGGFTNLKETENSLSSKRCNSHDYAPAEAVCSYLMQNGAVEFAGENAKRALMCLSRRMTFGEMIRLDRGEFDFHYGSDYRGSNLTLEYDEDHEIGGMVLAITAEGY